MHPRVFVISGPSGVGKSSIIRQAFARVSALRLSVSSTTRPPRSDEKDGRDYHFITHPEFEFKISGKLFLEWAKVYGNYYGTERAHVEELLGTGHHVLMDVDTQGAMNIKKNCSGAVLIFIKPPSIKELRLRLEGRGSESKESLNKRMAKAQHEISFAEEYDYGIINESMEIAIDEMVKIVESEGKNNIPFSIHL